MNHQICNVIALYDFEEEGRDLRGWFKYMERWFESIGVIPDTMGLTTSKKLIQYKSGKRKLEKYGFSDIKAISVLGGVSEAETNLNWKISTEICYRNKGLFYVCFDDAIHSLTKDYILKLVKDLSQFCPFKYGIGYQREFTKGPDWYVSGIIEGIKRTPENNREREQIGCWFKKYAVNNRYKTGLFRDIYPFNILTSSHLVQKVQNQSLGNWIRQNPGHGNLAQVTNHHWLWSLAPTQIPDAQESLQKSGLLLCYKV